VTAIEPTSGSTTIQTTSSELNSSIEFHPQRFTHHTKLPIADLPLDHALSNCHGPLSPWKYPDEWIDAETNYVQSIAYGISKLTENDGLDVVTLLRPAMIYQVSNND
jgi:hypothetical protein